MKLYRYIKISDNNNGSTNFDVDVTTMKQSSLRISSIKSQYKKFKNDNRLPYRDIYDILDGDWSWYEIECKEFEKYEQAKQHRWHLMCEHWNRMNPDKQPRNAEDYYDFAVD